MRLPDPALVLQAFLRRHLELPLEVATVPDMHLTRLELRLRGELLALREITDFELATRWEPAKVPLRTADGWEVVSRRLSSDMIATTITAETVEWWEELLVDRRRLDPRPWPHVLPQLREEETP